MAASATQTIDTLIEARWIVPVRPQQVVLENHCVAIDGGRIVDVIPVAQARTRYIARQRVALAEHALIPGLVNAHAHAAMSLLRGVGDDLPLAQWLQERIWPLERELVSAEFTYDGTLLAAVEMLRAGITCCNDMYFFPAEVAQALRRVGLRASVGIATIELPSRYATSADDYLRKGLAARDALKGDPLITFTLAPHAPYTVSDTVLERIATLAEELDLPVHMHVHETAAEIEQSLREHSCRPLERLERLGLVSERLIAVHATQLLETEIELLAQRGASVAHCPASNCKLASGVAPIARMLDMGICVAIGTDGSASNNRLDLLREMTLAALLAKANSGNASAMPSWQALECATLGGARALGLDTRIGTIEIGKEADLTAIDLSTIESQPCYEVISQIVHCAGREQVTHVWVAGDCLLSDRAIVNVNRPDVAGEAIRAAAPWQNHVRQKLRETITTMPASQHWKGKE
jgi:5-methylthioadenosine/S-adenosylhomocysteine deaminase